MARPVSTRPPPTQREPRTTSARPRASRSRQVLRLVRAVGVHLDNHVVASLEGPGEPARYVAPKPCLLGGAGRGPGRRPRPAGRRCRRCRPASRRRRSGCRPGRRAAHPPDEPLEVVPLVVRRDDDQDPVRASPVCRLVAGALLHAGRLSRRRRPTSTPAGAPTSPMPTRMTSGQPPRWSATVVSVRSGRGACSRAGVTAWSAG